MSLETNTYSWRAPSNIAFVKYWGKTGIQHPLNPSISMTLKNSVTETTLSVTSSNELNVSFFFDGSLNEEFGKKVKTFIQSITDIYPELKVSLLEFKSSNTFPHSAGIASSASGFAAISLCLLEHVYKCRGEEIDSKFYEDASNLARLGSGSACRSIKGNFCLWGEVGELGSLNYATEINVHENFKNICDSICIVDSGPKDVSSRVGHALMHNHPFKDKRVEQANKNIKELNNALLNGDWLTLGNILESEALMLHALMMTSEPSFILLKPESLKIIEKIKEFRNTSDKNIYFTIDAGPNIHLIHTDDDEIHTFIKDEISPLCESFILDSVGNGAEKLV